MNYETKSFQIMLPNGVIFQFIKSVFRQNQKSYDFMINNGKDNCYYKVGIIRDIDKLRDILFKEDK